MALHYLIFDACEDGEGHGSWEAMASVRTPQIPAVLSEVQRVLDWAEVHSPGPRAALDEGGAWDADQHVQADGEWTTVTLTIVGPCDWGDAMVAELSADTDLSKQEH